MSISVNDEDKLYVINFTMEKDSNIQVGKRVHYFTAGYYVYIGSAKNNIRKRVERHFKREKRNHWHLDYIRPYMGWICAYSFPDKIGECGLKDVIEQMLDGRVEIKGLGSSDCRCDTHFLHVDRVLSGKDVSYLRNRLVEGK